MRAPFLVLLLIAAVVGAAWSGPPARAGRAPYADDGPPSPVIYPAQRLPLIFSHATHLGRGGTCADCHADAATSRSAVDALLPGEAACRACHAIDRTQPEGVAAGPPTRCDACHVGFVAGEPPARVYAPTANLKFDHQAHVSRGQDCTGCHGTLTDVELATVDDLPRMRLCLGCHAEDAASHECSTCHLSDLGVLRTTLPEGELRPSGLIHGDAHDLGFAENHGAAASRDAGYCASCHQESDCADCHTGTVSITASASDFHGGDYVLIHAVEGRRNVPDCSTCHRPQTFCVGCHQRSGVAGGDTGDFDQDSPEHQFHPDDWVSLGAGGNRHAREARANLDSCASCHREDECLACHTDEVGSPQVNPHGPGWRNSSRCEALAARNPRMCTRCHITEAEVGCDW